MKPVKTVLLFSLILAVPLVSGLSVSIKSSCNSDEENMVSLNSTSTGGHLGEPELYDDQVCVEGATELELKQTCGSTQSVLFSLYSRNNSHFSIFPDYRYNVCSEDLTASVKNSCPGNSTAAFSVFSRDSSHAAALGVYGKTLCLSRQAPKNITVQLTGLSGSFYADNQPISTGETLTLVEYPYIVAEENGMTRGVVSYGDFVKLSRPSTGTASLTQQSSSFLLPYFKGGHEELEDEQEQVMERRFLNLLSPSFTYPIPDNPYVRVILEPDQKVEGFRDTLRGSIEIQAKNKGLEDGQLVITMKDVS